MCCESLIQSAPPGLCLLLHSQLKFMLIQDSVLVQVVPVDVFHDLIHLMLCESRVGNVKRPDPVRFFGAE